MSLWDLYLLSVCFHMSAFIMALFSDESYSKDGELPHQVMMSLFPIVNLVSTWYILEDVLKDKKKKA